MSLKRTIFPPQDAFGAGPDIGEGDFCTDHPEHTGSAGQDPQGGSGKHRKGHAAYAAHDEAPFGSFWGGERKKPASDSAPDVVTPEEDALAALSDDVLAGECVRRVCPGCQVKKDAEDTRLRALAELDNARKRLERERGEQVRFASEKVLADIIPSLDNLDLALMHAGSNAACEDFIAGVCMTRKLLQDALAKHGLAVVGEVGEIFDPAVHEAVGMANNVDVPDNHVCSLLTSGYKLHDRLLRPARVMVSKNC